MCADGTSCATTCTAGTTTGCADTVNSICNAAGTGCALTSGQPCTLNQQCQSGMCLLVDAGVGTCM